jgi:hypothetical protein
MAKRQALIARGEIHGSGRSLAAHRGQASAADLKAHAETGVLVRTEVDAVAQVLLNPNDPALEVHVGHDLRASECALVVGVQLVPEVEGLVARREIDVPWPDRAGRQA